MFIRRHIYVNECTFDDIVEIDTFRELKELDPVYDVWWMSNLEGLLVLIYLKLTSKNTWHSRAFPV